MPKMTFEQECLSVHYCHTCMIISSLSNVCCGFSPDTGVESNDFDRIEHWNTFPLVQISSKLSRCTLSMVSPLQEEFLPHLRVRCTTSQFDISYINVYTYNQSLTNLCKILLIQKIHLYYNECHIDSIGVEIKTFYLSILLIF